MKLIHFPDKEGLRLRPVTAALASSILPLMHACYPPVYEHLWEDGGNWYLDHVYNETAMRAELKETDARFWIVEWQGEAAGILRLCIGVSCPDTPNAKGLKLHRIYLHPSTHRQGVGRRLMNFVLVEAQALNCETVWLEAMDTQTDALRFYEQMGFVVSGTFRLTFERMHVHLRGMIRMKLDL